MALLSRGRPIELRLVRSVGRGVGYRCPLRGEVVFGLDGMTALMWFALGVFMGVPVGIFIAALCCANGGIER